MGQTRKMRFLLASALFAAVSALPAAQDDCKPVTVQPNFNLTKFVGGVGGVGKWYIHKEMTIKYLPVNERYCVVASYTQKDATHVKVHNYANLNHTNGPVDDSDVHVKSLGGICGISKDKTTEAKLEVGPCDLSIISRFAFGSYWVVAAGDLSCIGADCAQPEGDYEWAFVSGGQPTHKTSGGCIPGTGVNDSGMWIFTKNNVRDEKVLSAIRAVATAKGYDVNYLNDVTQEGCKYLPPK